MRNERGFVSLLTCILLSLLLIVITVSLVSLEAVQLRKSEDSEQTLRAYYAAEAGIEDAAANVANGTLTTDQTCTNPIAQKLNYDVPGAAGWTCQQVIFSGSPTGILKAADTAKTIDPIAADYDDVVIEWNQSPNPSPARYNIASPTLPTAAGYTYAAPPIELAIVQYPDIFAGNTPLTLNNALFIPRGSGAGVGVVQYSTISTTSQQFDANCAPGSPRSIAGGLITSRYNCWAEIKAFSNARPGGNNYLFRLRSRYTPTSYKMTFFKNNRVVQVPDGTATIDVTAKAGDTFRRVVSKIPIVGGAAGGLNYVMYSDTNICKGFDVLGGSPVAGSGCPY